VQPPMAVTTPSRARNDLRQTATTSSKTQTAAGGSKTQTAAGSKAQRSEVGSPVKTPKVMFTGVVADNAEKV